MKTEKEMHEGHHLCDKNQYDECTLWERIKLAFYLVFSKKCREYTKRNLKLTKSVKDPQVKHMPVEDKNALKEQLQKELFGQS